ncbi:hypothetical protein jhhlp_001056 [Lomentospora prolificans]|uniref:MARVEL domain-containing protein n=1 Tax=Lomentospora prolificans TaxID=41688 RepID=A0A2N3N6Z3_9PEZI|nr:hypothetical protein jhhlp_005151 [Lomentospora prolificans]PKS12844.1 hypothetical protein jhhlp_001056 [Lomentospora prolificans]
MAYRIIHRKWRLRKPMWWGMVLELLGLVPILVLFGIEQPDLYRTKFWQIGFDNKLNSNPNMILYAYANHRPLPTIPFVWSQSLTDFNVAISVIALFLLLTKLIAFIMKVWYPLLAVFINVAAVALWTTSVYGQIGPDFADPRYPSPVAWYIRMGCDIAKPYNAVRLCMIAKGTLAVTVYMLFLYLMNLALAIHSMLPNELDKVEEEEEEEDSVVAKNNNVELKGMMSPATPGVPYTPRTMAFRTLDRKGPSTYA